MAALVHADATFEQINDFCVEFIVGSIRPFIWTPIPVAQEMITRSKGRKSEFSFLTPRTGPSKYFMRQKSEEMAREVMALFSKEGKTDARITDNV